MFEIIDLTLENDGVEIVSGLIVQQQIDDIISELNEADDDIAKHGIRNEEKKLSTIACLVNSKSVRRKVREILGDNALLVRVILFDKTADKNWLVAWHQDKTVSVSERFDLEG